MSIFALKKEKKYIKRKPLNSGTCGQAVNSKSVCSIEVEVKRLGVSDIMWNLEQIKRRNPRSCNSQGIR